MEGNDFQIVQVRCSHDDYIQRQINYQKELGIDDPLAVVDIDEVVERYRKWYKLLPRVKLFYALKCNNDEEIIDSLVKLGSSFDCASKGEIKQILDCGVDPSRIIYANPCKQNSHISYAQEHDVDMMTFDNEKELIKIMMLYKTAKLLLRFRPNHLCNVDYDLGMKFGCASEEATGLFLSAKNKGLNIIGVSFHVGSNCLSSDAFSSSIKEARVIFDIGLQIGFAMEILDIGGGFRGRDVDQPTIEETAGVINQRLDEYFPETDGVKVIAEPGRYLVEAAVSIGVNIIGQKLIYGNDKTIIEHVMYSINDGIYGSFSRINDGTRVLVMSPVTGKDRKKKHKSTLWGPTCAVTDCLAVDIHLPLMEVGEWACIKYTGAYSFCRSSNFNSMPRPKMYYFCSRDTWETLKAKD